LSESGVRQRVSDSQKQPIWLRFLIAQSALVPKPDIAARQHVKFDDEQFAALFNELQARGDKNKLMQLFGH
jgi:hypothetical protein